MKRGYTLDRGKGIRRRGITHEECPQCGKRGLSKERVVMTIAGARLVRSCRYCQHTESKKPS